MEVEFGTGKGRFLIARAEQHPEIQFLGVDRVSKWMKIGWKRAQKRGLKNLNFLKWDSRDSLDKIPSGIVFVFHIYFPDPWPKKRHHKRRMINAEFLTLLHDRLQMKGLVEIATDDIRYYDEIKKAVRSTRTLWHSVRESVDQRLAFDIEKTNYELKYEAAGKNLYYLELEKL